ncbi:MAG: transposase family protein [Actinobacteria bacterium]|nr:transposase family protein [Actinomycetota bacterium]
MCYAGRFARGEIFAFTGLGDTAFADLVSRLWQVRPDKTRGRPWSLTFADRVLLVVMALRTNLTERQLAWLFATSDSTVDRVIRDMSVHLAGLFHPLPEDQRFLWIVDGTLVPTEDHTRSAKSKNYRRSTNVQVVCRRKDRRIVTVGAAWPGNRNDVVVYKETVASGIAQHRRLIGDGGYRGAAGVTTPIRVRTAGS